MTMPPQPMLATRHGKISKDRDALIANLTARGWIAEEKLDGVRGLIAWDAHGYPTVWNRRGVSIGGRWPELLQVGAADTVIDGEIVCRDEEGRVDFDATHRRDAQNGITVPAGATLDEIAEFAKKQFIVARNRGELVAFDILRLRGEDLAGLPYTERVERLAGVWPNLVERSADGPALWAEVTEVGGEGIVMKDPASPYTPGRRSDRWVKFRRTRVVSAMVGGFQPGKGARAGTFGSLKLLVLDGDNFVPIGEVGTGFTNQEIAELWDRLRAGTATVVDVEYHSFRLGGSLRFPVYRGLREDVEPIDCTLDQLLDG